MDFNRTIFLNTFRIDAIALGSGQNQTCDPYYQAGLPVPDVFDIVPNGLPPPTCEVTPFFPQICEAKNITIRNLLPVKVRVEVLLGEEVITIDIEPGKDVTVDVGCNNVSR